MCDSTHFVTADDTRIQVAVAVRKFRTQFGNTSNEFQENTSWIWTDLTFSFILSLLRLLSCSNFIHFPFI